MAMVWRMNYPTSEQFEVDLFVDNAVYDLPENSNDNMEVSQIVQNSQHAITSPDGKHVALINNTRLEIRSASTLHLLRSISIPTQTWTLKWSSQSRGRNVSERILIFDDEHVRVWDLLDDIWTATIKNGSGGMGKIANAGFGRTKDEVLVFSDFSSKVTLWSLQSRRQVEIRDPKFSAGGFAYRPHGGQFALLSRPSTQDILTLHELNTYALAKTIALTTSDAQGFKWSLDGRWIAIWDTPSVGLKVHVYTADGHLYRTHHRESADGLEGLGVKSLEWSPRSDYLAIGSHDRRVTLLSTRTFSPSMHLDHTPSIQLTEGNSVWEEAVSASSQRSYSTAAQPVAPPTASQSPQSSDQLPKIGISSLSFNSNGALLATMDATTPTTVWLWDLSSRTAKAVLIQHSPVKSVLWHPTLPSLLLIQCTHEESTIYIYDANSSMPYAVHLPLQKAQGRFIASWINTTADQKPCLLFGDTGNFMIAWPDGKDVIVRFEDQTEGESEDSLFEILTGRKSPSKERRMVDSTEVLVSAMVDEETAVLDDTFMGRGRLIGA